MTEPTLEQVAIRVAALEEAHRKLDRKVDENTRVTTAVKADTGQLLDFVKAYKATKLIGGALGKFLLWISPLVSAVVALWTWRGRP